MSEQKFDPKDFDKAGGEVFGGSYPRLEILPGNVSDELQFVKWSKITIDDDKNPGQKKDLAVPVFSVVDSDTLVTGPIGAIFTKCWEEAKIQIGDVFRVKRYADVKKKTGAGANSSMMQVFGIRVYSRAANSPRD